MKKIRYGLVAFSIIHCLLAACRRPEGTDVPTDVSPSPMTNDGTQALETPAVESASSQTAELSPLAVTNTPSMTSRTIECPASRVYEALSANNEWVVCQGDALWVQRVGNSNWRQITTYESGLSLAEWSPDATRLAVTGWFEPVWLYEVGNWDERVMIYDNNGEWHGHVSWSPDGRYLIAQDLMSGLILIHADGSGSEQLLEEGAIGNPMFGGVEWSPDGQEIVYWTNPDLDYMNRPPVDFELWSIDIETRERRFLYGPALRAGENFPVWSSDGQQIAFLLSPGDQGTFGVAILNLATMDTRIIELPEMLLYVKNNLVWSPDSSHIAMVASPYEGIGIDSDIWLLSIETGEARQYTQTRDCRWIIRWNEEGIITLMSHELSVDVLELVIVDE